MSENITPISEIRESTQANPRVQKQIFLNILYAAMIQDGTFGDKPSPLYPKHIALHALLGYLWGIAEDRSQVIAVMKAAGLLKTITQEETKDDTSEFKKKSSARKIQSSFRKYKEKKTTQQKDSIGSVEKFI